MAERALGGRIVYEIDDMRRVEPRRGIVYRRDAGADLTLDVYQPPGKK